MFTIIGEIPMSLTTSFDFNRAFVDLKRAFVDLKRAFVDLKRAFVNLNRAFGDLIEWVRQRHRNGTLNLGEPTECQPFGLNCGTARICLTHFSSIAYGNSRRSVPMPLQ